MFVSCTKYELQQNLEAPPERTHQEHLYWWVIASVTSFRAKHAHVFQPMFAKLSSATAPLDV